MMLLREITCQWHFVNELFQNKHIKIIVACVNQDSLINLNVRVICTDSLFCMTKSCSFITDKTKTRQPNLVINLTKHTFLYRCICSSSIDVLP